MKTAEDLPSFNDSLDEIDEVVFTEDRDIGLHLMQGSEPSVPAGWQTANWRADPSTPQPSDPNPASGAGAPPAITDERNASLQLMGQGHSDAPGEVPPVTNSGEATDQAALLMAAHFDVDFYLDRYPDVRAAGVDALQHYITHGHDEGRNPAPWFSTNQYRVCNADVLASGLNAFYHYLQYGRYESRPGVKLCAVENEPSDSISAEIGGHFDTDYYLNLYPDVREAGADPLQHYIDHGHNEGRDPAPWFSTNGYRASNPDVADAGVNVFHHYLMFGYRENRLPAPVDDILADSAAARSVAASGIPSVDAGGKLVSEIVPDWVSTLDHHRISALLGLDCATLRFRQRLVRTTAMLSDVLAQTEEGTGQDHAPALPDGSELAAHMLAASTGKVLSLDVWDTILRRDCSPDAIKLRQARAQWLTDVEPATDLGQLHPVDLLQLRRMAEADAADEHCEYRIGDVAERLAPLFQSSGAKYKAKFVAREIRIEKSAISADPVIKELIAKHDGRKIVLSDFYMPGKALEKLLAHVGITGIDQFYSSCDHMATKRAGDLYDVALASEDLHGEAVLHVGDRFTADVLAAQKRGLHAFHYFSPSHQPRLEKLESDFWKHFQGDDAVHARNIAGTFGHSADGEVSLEILSVAATGFVLHVMEEALRRRLDTIFFMTREGVFFQRIYDALVGLDVFDIGRYPKSEVIEVSRRATFAASLGDFSSHNLMRMWSQYSTQSLRALGTSLNIDHAIWDEAALRHGLDPDDVIVNPWEDAGCRAFMADATVLQTARQAIARQNVELLRYLERKGFEPRAHKRRLIVDIGWRGTIQDNLAHIVGGTIHGCYFGLSDFLNPQSANSSKTGYVFDSTRGYPLHLEEVAGLEFLFNSAGGSVRCYENGKAIRDVVPEEEAIVAGSVAKMQDRLLKAAKDVGHYVRKNGLVSHDLVGLSREVVQAFANRPPSEVAQAFFDLVHNESFGVGHACSMRPDDNDIAKFAKLDGSQLHGELSRWLGKLRWPSAARCLPAFQSIGERLQPTQRLHVPVAPAIVRCQSLGRPVVAVLSPPPIRGSGGHRTILNMAAALGRSGYDVHVMHESGADPATDAWVGAVLGDAQVTQHNAWMNWMQPAASVATIWYSNEFSQKLWSDSTTQFYFVQDYEAMFNPMGDTFLRASQSYAQGARHISVGRWLAHALRSQFGVGVASGGLGVDHMTYRPLEDVCRSPRQIAMLYQPEKYRRAPELCIAALAIVKEKLPDARIVLYGSDQRPQLHFDHEHLGLITDVNEINRLYNESAVGLCISTTNPSRIPFEMMASGCVPVDVYRYNNLFDYDAGCGLLAHESPESLAEALLKLLTDPAFCGQRAANGLNSVANRSLEWEMDVAVNAVSLGLEGVDFDVIESARATYTDNPVLAAAQDNRSTRHFLDHQWRLASEDCTAR